MSALPDPLAVLAVASDETRHAPTRELLSRMPETHSEIHWVASTDAALAALAERRQDVVLLDADADPEGGTAAARRILTQAPHVPVILIARAPDPEQDRAAADAGVSDFLVIADLAPQRLERSIRYAVAHKRALDTLAQSGERHALALRGTNDGLWDWDVANDRLYLSPRWKAMLGYAEDEVGDTREEWLERVHPDDRAPLAEALEAHLSGAAEHFEFEHRARHRDGGYRWMLARGTAVRDPAGRPLRIVGSQTDVTDRKESERRLQHDAMHDALTGLPNRVLFLDRLDQAIRRAQRRHPEASAAVLFLDLDHFKLVNDSLGHLAGDRLLVDVAGRLESVLRPNDTVARLGGDEFTLLLDDVTDVREAILIAERVQQTLAEPFELDGREFHVGASIGIAVATADSVPEEVLRDADVAMYRAKGAGKGRHAVFDAGMHEQVVRRMDMEGELRRAIERRGLDVAYQPIVQAATSRLVGFEALCRWADVEPDEFVPLAEETGLVLALGRWVLETACAQLARWRRLPHGAGLTMSVNVSARELAEAGFVEMLREVLEATGAEPRALRLEVSEGDLSPEAGAVLERAFRDLGVRSHIDDFGTGASSLRLLHRFPGDAVKVWRGLVAGMGRDAGSFEIVRAIVGLAHNLGLEVIAEGVETREQLDYLKVLGCEFAQGFHISRPLTADAAGALVGTGVPAA
jgi:diguanylate cyclase (GGDEF)-like protein/PAS domain S-box-containing protein